MSIWIDPKTDWHPSNEECVSGDDFNRIEQNAAYLFNRHARHISVSGNVPVLVDIYAAGSTVMQPNDIFKLQQILITVPDGYKLQAVQYRVAGLASGCFLEFHIENGVSLGNITNFDSGHMEPGVILFNNDSGADQDKIFVVQIENVSAGTHYLDAIGWVIDLQIIPIT